VRQQELFPTSAPDVPGLLLVEEFVDPARERELVRAIDAAPWQEDFRRRIQQYGLGYGVVGRGAPQWVGDFPPWLTALARDVVDQGFLPRMPDNSVVNEYPPGIGIGPHRDYADYGAPVVCVSLGADIVIDFDDPTTGAKVPVDVPARSLWSVDGDARWVWRHGIAARRTDKIGGLARRRFRRVSVTFRLRSDA
jgi:alkylated DNA repair dioxygenase AlkB